MTRLNTASFKLQKDIMQDLLHNVCHQHLDRTLVVAGHFLPLCSRCSGIYIGFMVTFLVLLAFLVLKNRNRALSPGASMINISIAALILCEDVAASRYGYRETSNISRFVVGMILGNALALSLVPGAITALTAEKVTTIRSWWQGLLLPVYLCIVHAVVTTDSILLYNVFSISSIAGLVLIGGLVNFHAIRFMLSFFHPGSHNPGPRSAMMTALVSLLLVPLEIFLYGLIPVDKRNFFLIVEKLIRMR